MWRHLVYRNACMFQICLKGKVHIFKYLNIQACRMDKKPDTLDLPSLGKRCLPQPLTDRYGRVYQVLFPRHDEQCICSSLLIKLYSAGIYSTSSFVIHVFLFFMLCLKMVIYQEHMPMFSFTVMNRKPNELPVVYLSSMEDFYPSKNHGPDSGIGSDNGDKRLSTTEVQAFNDCNANM